MYIWQSHIKTSPLKDACMDAEGIVNYSILTTWLPSDPCSTVLIGEEQPYTCIHYTVGPSMHLLVYSEAILRSPCSYSQYTKILTVTTNPYALESLPSRYSGFDIQTQAMSIKQL